MYEANKTRENSARDMGDISDNYIGMINTDRAKKHLQFSSRANGSNSALGIRNTNS